MAIPKEGYVKLAQGRYGPIFPKTHANDGFTLIAKRIPGRGPAVYAHPRTIERAVAGRPDCLAVLTRHDLRWQLFNITGETYF